MLGHQLWALREPQQRRGSPPPVPRTPWSTSTGAGLFGAVLWVSWRPGSLRSFDSSCLGCSLNQQLFSRSGYALGIDEKWLQRYLVWVDRTPDRLFVIYARCTHLGCTPDWKPAENKFKCPCHGSGYDSEGINFEGPAPRPMDRARIEVAPDGQMVVDVGRLYSWPKGQRDQFNDPGAFLPA